MYTITKVGPDVRATKKFGDTSISSRHVKMRLKSVRKLRNSGVIGLDYVQTAKNLADQLTQGLSRNVIDNASMEMGLRPT